MVAMGLRLALLLSLLAVAGCSGDGWYTPRTLDGSSDLFGVGGSTDSDGDGIPDAHEGTGDIDGDGIPNHLDTDSDGDGIPDGDDDDVDGDGLSNSEEGSGDDDGDGIPNDYDLDSDGDGIPDSDEAGDDDDAAGDDDDATGDDDDATGDDDDATGDDDDATGDDDDATGDDDDATGDDDDSTPAGAYVVVTASATDLGLVAEGTLGLATVTLENQGGALAFVDLSLSAPVQQGEFLFAITGGNPVFTLYSGASETRYVEFTPPVVAPPGVWETDLEADWGGPAVTVLTFVAETGAAGEGSCTDGLDGDGDGDIDCDDGDCGADPACATVDFCCSQGDANTNGFCWDPAAASCACAADSWCCSGGWDAGCVAEYQGCGATTCGP
jgi:hypothetical protein